MMYNTKLNEFSAEQIDSLLALVKEELDTLISCSYDVSKWDESELKEIQTKQFDSEIETMLLWKVQLENAKSDINEMIKINAG